MGNMAMPTTGVHKILAELREERDQLGEAIVALERLVWGGAQNVVDARPSGWWKPARKRTTEEKGTSTEIVMSSLLWRKLSVPY
jgi:hypothetical protein